MTSLPIVELMDTTWIRIHLDMHGPFFFSRNPNHRFSPAEGKHQVMYAASDFRTAFMEVFGDVILGQRAAMGPCISASRWHHSMCSTISPGSLRLCDFTTNEARSAIQADLASLLHPDLGISHQWADAVMRHPDEVDGILYPSRFTGRKCLALFDGGGNIPAQESVAFSDHKEALSTLHEMMIALV